MSWKYGMILVGYEDEIGRFIPKSDLNKIAIENRYPIHLMVELYDLDKDGRFECFCEANPKSVDELKLILKDIENDGINTWFYEHGNFEWKEEKSLPYFKWDWKLNDSAEKN